MNDTATTHQQQIREFFNQWHIYQTIIRENYMQHREMAESLREVLQERYAERAFAVLDLGCGDAHLSAKVLQGLPVAYYCGVDLSDRALQYAEQNMQPIPCEKNFTVDDLAHAIAHAPRRYDAIIAGYSLHHLSYEAKEAFFHACADALKADGIFLLYDVISRENEARQAYLERKWQAYSQWTQLTPEQLLRVKQHVFEKDYPESFATLTQMARSNGFQRVEALYSDSRQLFQAGCFYH
ncbi:MAG: class I SAM-dependent DNA methyltransferase [Gammaproteobacteria bacterium]